MELSRISNSLIPGRRPALERSRGAIEVGFACIDGRTRLKHLFQKDPGRVLFPDVAAAEPPQAVLITTSGGLTGGDRLDVALRVAAGGVASFTTQAAEKIYRSDGADCELSYRISAGEGAFLEWMPQETILFDGARLVRVSELDAAADASILAGDMMVYGRLARGERFQDGLLYDSWSIRREGQPVWRDAFRLAGDIAWQIGHPAGLGGATAAALLLLLAPRSGQLIDAVRDCMASQIGDGVALRGAATALREDLLLIRLLGQDVPRLRASYAALWRLLRTAQGLQPVLPRVWDC